MNPGKSLLIVYHSQSGNTERLAKAVEDGAAAISEVTVSRLKASATTVDDLKNCGTLVICSPEYFGYMAGAVKDMLDRTYEEVRDHMFRKPYAVVICAGNDGTGALTSIDRIIAGFRMKKVQDPIICRGSISDDDLSNCRRLGETLAAGMDLGIY
jgi:multimeric flavodoxin WrbA